MNKIISRVVLTGCIFSIASATFACSEFNHNFGGDLGVYTTRTMDLFIDLKPNLTIYPRGTKETGGLKNNSLTWTDKYGYVSIDETNLANLTGEGLNEKGLVAHLLYLGDTIQPKRDTSKPGVNGLYWIRYVLGNFATVKEVLDNLDSYQIYNPPIEINGKESNIPVHYMVEDKTGDSALIEYINGKLTVHRNVKAISNEPSYDEQQKILRQAKELGFYNIDKLPGGANSAYRFVRTTFISENLPKAKSMNQAVNYMFAAADSVSVPFIKGYRNESLNNPSL
ncbi:linear amide C-N hydrolase [Francisella tularensis]|uniref:Linear amide C-N hydrolase, choloylglycine hydrolase family protein n=2 Tax=Francisella tularensis TaxID=263 RepID=A0AAW3D5G0_FRATU|nr:linear amide C-N hydrolase [Francisella tularensis]ABO46463.1 choloylglycine hydrolase family protein [Francisella tularensis subsp. tularensis WY96-3418]ADA78974.1 choloylglycine hydrolase family protein [Francisella tularensis subsp. tularensis NE061598]AJI68646.1 linear amide C-N hydrolase, choloylglycine hydrolase family protein [Francisella tularensis subsp. tularensis SCHU S4]AJI70757.1 linear amide C-N hydrolase, choloylglycine hydrolase family protein [Francisella tularensis subsp. t